MGLSKLINKVNKAKSAVNSLKGISSKIKSLNYNSVTDQLGEEAEKAQKHLREERKRKTQTLKAKTIRDQMAAATPEEPTKDLMYPINDELDNYLIFGIRNRRNKATQDKTNQNAASVMSGENTKKDSGIEIALYVPSDLSSTSAASYGKADFGLSARMMGQFADNVKDKGFKALFDMDSASGAGALASQQLTSFLNTLSGGTENVKAGRAKNPMQEAMFEGISFREWSFDYEFWPRNEAEAIMVNNIIYSFRSAMLPDTYGSALTEFDLGIDINEDENYFNFPNIFDVEIDGPLKDHVEGFLPMVCTKCDVDHFNNGNNTTFANGAPISQSMSLSFQEIKLLTQESYQEISPLGKEGITSMKSFTDLGENARKGMAEKPRPDSPEEQEPKT